MTGACRGRVTRACKPVARFCNPRDGFPARFYPNHHTASGWVVGRIHDKDPYSDTSIESVKSAILARKRHRPFNPRICNLAGTRLQGAGVDNLQGAWSA